MLTLGKDTKTKPAGGEVNKRHHNTPSLCSLLLFVIICIYNAVYKLVVQQNFKRASNPVEQKTHRDFLFADYKRLHGRLDWNRNQACRYQQDTFHPLFFYCRFRLSLVQYF